MMFERPNTATNAEMLEKFAVKELVEYERFCRDNGLWEQMHQCYAEDSTVSISWYQGSGSGFVEASRRMESRAPHKLFSTLVWLNQTADRAVAVTMGCVQMRQEATGQICDLTSFVRFFFTVQRQADRWMIHSMRVVYEKDCLVPAAPAQMDAGQGRESYRNLTALMTGLGRPVDDSLPGEDRPETVRELEENARQWLGA